MNYVLIDSPVMNHQREKINRFHLEIEDKIRILSSWSKDSPHTDCNTSSLLIPSASALCQVLLECMLTSPKHNVKATCLVWSLILSKLHWNGAGTHKKLITRTRGIYLDIAVVVRTGTVRLGCLKTRIFMLTKDAHCLLTDHLLYMLPIITMFQHH